MRFLLRILGWLATVDVDVDVDSGGGEGETWLDAAGGGELCSDVPDVELGFGEAPGEKGLLGLR